MFTDAMLGNYNPRQVLPVSSHVTHNNFLSRNFPFSSFDVHQLHKKSDLISTLKVINDTGTRDMQLKPNLEVRQTSTLIDHLVSSKKVFSSEGLPPFESIKPYLHKISMSVGILLSLNHQSYLYVNTTEGSSVQNSFFYLRCFCKVSQNTTKSAVARSLTILSDASIEPCNNTLKQNRPQNNN